MDHSNFVDNFDTCSIENIGQTWEGRDMNVLKICSGNCGDNPVMYVECSKSINKNVFDLIK